MKQSIKIGEKVIFDKSSVDIFILETTNVSEEISQYQKLVLAGIDQVGTVIECGPTMSTVSYGDGWNLPIPTKYLLLSSD